MQKVASITKIITKHIILHLIIYPALFLVKQLDYMIGMLSPPPLSEHEIIAQKNGGVFSKQTDTSDTKSPYRSTFLVNEELMRIDDPNDNLYNELCKNIDTFKINSVFDEKQLNGKIFKKYALGNYTWSTYEEVFNRINNLSNGLLKLGLKSEQNIVLFSETRAEWLLSAFSCFKIKAPVVTLYATLGIEALPFGINQTKASFLFTSADQLPKIQKVIEKISNIRKIIVFVDNHNESNLSEFKKIIEDKNLNGISILTINEVENIGKTTPLITEFTKPKKDDLAVIMYTSGSTGNPKGVMMSHANLLICCKGLKSRTKFTSDDIYISYLPLAHIFELSGELICFLDGIPIGYSSPQTITDASTGIPHGQMGDLRVLNPTIMAAVPIILERLNKAVNEKLSSAGWISQTMFKVAYKQKLKKLRNGNSSTQLLDHILFKKIKNAVLGKKIRLIISGGAILSKNVQEFTRVCFAPTMQAYGLTETSTNAATQLAFQSSRTETVGSVLPTCEIRLIDWDEGGYRTTDKPNPRGEILIGGENITMGYYEMPEKTKEDYFYVNGIRYFATGDIGEILPDGDLKIIDRKKDLVKLSTGEYISLNKIESIIKLMSFVDNVCVIANPLKSYCIALICPNLKKLKEIIKEEDSTSSNIMDEKNPDILLAELCKLLANNEKIVSKLTKEIVNNCIAQGVDRFEIPARYKFVKEIWMPDTGLVTDSLKLKRKEIDKFYSNEIQELYKY